MARESLRGRCSVARHLCKHSRGVLELRARVPGRVGDRSSSRQCALAFSKPDVGGGQFRARKAEAGSGGESHQSLFDRQASCMAAPSPQWQRPHPYRAPVAMRPQPTCASHLRPAAPTEADGAATENLQRSVQGVAQRRPASVVF